MKERRRLAEVWVSVGTNEKKRPKLWKNRDGKVENLPHTFRDE
jgi:hypothetical protein